MTEYELSQATASSSATGGFLQFSDGSEAYLAASGNDYGFATPTFGDPSKPEPTIGTLHTRCVACHGGNGSVMMSLAVQDPARPRDARAAAAKQGTRRVRGAEEGSARGFQAPDRTRRPAIIAPSLARSVSAQSLLQRGDRRVR